MPRRIPIRLKLAAALAVPIFALLLVAVLEIAQSRSRTAEIREQNDLATASIGPGGLITGLQNERNYGSLYILGFEGALQLPVTSFDEAAAATDDAIATFRAEIQSKGGDVQRTYEPALDAVEEQLDGLRAMVTELEGDRSLQRTEVSDPFFNGYTSLIDTLFRANGQVAISIDDPTLRRGVELTDLTTHQIENLARTMRVVLLAGVGDGLADRDEVAETAGLVGQINSNLDQTTDLGTGRYRAATEAAKAEFEAGGFLDLVNEAIETGDVRLTETMNSLSREPDEGFNGYRAAINDEITARAQELDDEATASQRRYMALGVLALAVAVVVTWLVSRSITKPLRSLTRQAKHMAEDRLPLAVNDILETPLGEDVTVPTVDPVVVRTRDEVSDVADALNTVQDSALDLAVEQAVLRRNIADSFVNLGRRNQNLLGRQLDFITELESNEADPDTLANLFRLDHLATRMRRNAESLLVLAGIEPPRKWAAPVRLTDVIRAALGEVEDYQRVTVRGVEPATILGSAAADLAHLLAELIENALVFSPPDQTVDIRGRHRSDGTGDGGYTLAIIDSGLGMPAADIAAANRRLAGAESFTIAPSKYLGHYVAGNLAARHDIHVSLANSPGNGITATIDLPPTLLTTDAEADLAAPVTPPHGLPAVQAPPPPAPAVGPGDGWTAFPDGPGVDAPFDGMPGPATVTPPINAPSRTASGLVKRSPRGAEPARAAAIDGDLLASLSSVTGQRGTPPPLPSAAVPPPPAHPGPGAGAGNGAPPPLPRRAPAAYEPAAYEPSDPARGAGGSRSWPAPPSTRPAVPGDGGFGPGPGDGTDRPPLTPRRPAAGNGGPPRADGPGRPPQPSGPESTPSGLARRVRGAQLPTTQPLSLRRNQVPPSGGAAGYRLGDIDNANGPMLGSGTTNGYSDRQANGRANGHDANGDGGAGDPEESSAARSVYGFLTSFTQGVQRGLEEVRRDPNTPKENP